MQTGAVCSVACCRRVGFVLPVSDGWGLCCPCWGPWRGPSSSFSCWARVPPSTTSTSAQLWKASCVISLFLPSLCYYCLDLSSFFFPSFFPSVSPTPTPHYHPRPSQYSTHETVNEVQLQSVNIVSVCSEKPICASPRLSVVSPTLPLRHFQCFSDGR